MNIRTGSILSITVRISIAIGIVWLLFRFVNIGESLNNIGKVDTRWMLFAYVFSTMGVVLNTFRWRLLCKGQISSTPSFFKLLIGQYSGQFLNVFLPTDFGGDAYRVHFLWRQNEKLQGAFLSVAITRLLGLFSIGITLLVGMVLHSSIIPEPWIQGLLWAVVFIIASAIIVLVEGTWPQLILQGIAKKAGGFRKIRYSLDKIIEGVNILPLQRLSVLLSLFLGVFFQFILFLNIYCYSRALHFHLSFSEIILPASILFLASAMPFSINGIGIREGGFVLFFSWVGLSKEESFAIALLSRCVSGVLQPLTGGLFFFFSRYVGHPKAKRP